MKGYSLKTRNLVSTWFSLTFFLLLISYLGFIEFFQDSRHQESAVSLLNNPIRADIISNVNAIKFKNRLGSYTMTKVNESWILKEPRVIPAKEATVKQILDSLGRIKVHTIHQYEPINFQSFSLDKPIIEIDLYTKLDEKISVLVGLINPIDNTSYITVSGHNRIFQTKIFEGKLETLALASFIDSNVFSMPIDKISEFKLFHSKKNDTFNHFSQNGGLWSAKKFKTINNTKTTKKIQNILDIKTHKIIDNQDDELKNFISNYISSPLYRIEIKQTSEDIVTYTISHLIKGIPELKLEKKQYFIMTASDRTYPYIVHKNFLNDFIIRYADIRN
ncbi:MAG: hypothetical protein ACJAS4_001106 [Bacteriovoracaceae bacterium]|jgi:hypothetical protein